MATDQAHEELIAAVQEKAAAFGNPGCYPTMCGILESMLLTERQQHQKEIRALKEEKNPDPRLEDIAQVVRTYTLDTSDDRDDLIAYLQKQIRELEDLELEEGGISFEDLAYETERDMRMGLV